MSKAYRLIVEDGGKVRQLEFDRDEVTVGRTKDNQVTISDALSSRHHCQVRRTPEGCVVEDLKSRNGTKLNGGPLTESTLLSPGDRIEVGDTVIHFERRRDKPTKKLTREEAEARASSRRRPSRTSGAPVKEAEDATLRVLEGDAKGKVIPIEALPFLCGRKKGSGLALTDSDVSNEHCMIVADSGVLHLVDLGSTNGTFINNARLKGRAPLLRGALIRLGATLTLRIEVGDEASSLPPAKQPSARKKKVSARKKRPVEPAAVDEVADLDDLDDDLEVLDEPAASKPRASKPRPKADSVQMKDSAQLVAEEADVIAVELGAGIDESDERFQGGGQLGVVAIVVALLLVMGSVGYAAKLAFLETAQGDPSPEGNLLENWSFEEVTKQGPASWELFADKSHYVTGGEAAYGERAVALTVHKALARPELRSTAQPRVTPGDSYRVRAAVLLDNQICAALRVDWLSDDNPDFLRTSFAVLTDPAQGAGGGWQDIGGTVVAPHGANKARVVAVALGSGETTGTARFDRILLQKGQAPKGAAKQAAVLKTPVRGLQARIDPRGVITIHRAAVQLAHGIGLVLDPNDPLATQTTARVDQPLARQTDQSLLALGAIPNIGKGTAREEYTFTARAGSEGLRVRWSLNPAGKDSSVSGPIQLRFVINRFQDLGRLELDGLEVKSVPKDGVLHEKVGEMAWGSGKQQVSFGLTAPADVTLKPDPGGLVVITLAMRGDELATGRREVGFDILAASQRTREALRRLLRRASTARRLGKFDDAKRAYRRVIREYPGENWKSEVATARRGLKSIDRQADRLARVVTWAYEKAEEMPVAALLTSAESAVRELEQGFPGSKQLERAKRDLGKLRTRLREAANTSKTKEVTKLVSRARSLREKGHVRMARLIYEYVVKYFDADVPGVREAKNRLAALPPETGGD